MTLKSPRLTSSLYDLSLDQSPPDAVLVCNPTEDKLLVQAEHMPAWLHCSFDWLHEPVLLEPGEERTLEFWMDPYIPGGGLSTPQLAQEIVFLSSAVRSARILSCERDELNPPSLSVTIHTLAREGMCQRCTAASFGLVLIGLCPLIAMMLTPQNPSYLFAMALPVSLIFWIAWVVRRGLARGWLEHIYSRCKNPDDRRLVLNIGRIYGRVCDRTRGRMIQLLLFPPFYCCVLFVFSFAYMGLDLVGWTDVWFGRLLIVIGYLILLGSFILSIYPESLSKLRG